MKKIACLLLTAVLFVLYPSNDVMAVDAVVDQVSQANLSVRDKEFVSLKDTSVWLIINDVEKLENGTYTYGNQEMFWSKKYQAYCILVVGDKPQDFETVAINESVATKVIDYGGDVNVTKSIDSNDAQLIDNIYNSQTQYTGFTDTLTMEKYLRADIDGNGIINVEDSAAVVAAIVAKRYGKPVDEAMKNKNYTIQYWKDSKWIEWDAMSVNTMRWSGWERVEGIGAFANIRTDESELRIRVRCADTEDWIVRPMENVSDFVDNGTTVEFTISNNSFVSIEPNGDRTKNLLIRTSEKPADITDTGNVTCTNVIRLGPGVHDFESCNLLGLTQGMPTLRLGSGDHLILEEGAVLRAKIVADNVENIAITGTGIIDMAEWNGYTGDSPFRADAMRFTNCNNIYVGDITVRNCSFFTLRGNSVTNLEVRGLSSFSGVYEGDGIDFHGAIGVKISNCFLRNSDDCIAFYPDYTDIRDIEVSDCVLWSDRAHTINMGTHGGKDPENRHYIENVTFKDIDVLECLCPSPDYQGVIGISLGDESICRNLLFENFRIDDFKNSQVFVLKIMKLEPWNPNPGYLIENITLRNIVFNGDNKNGSTIIGYDAERVVRDITIEDFYINGQKMTTLEEAKIKVNEFTSGITIQ